MLRLSEQGIGPAGNGETTMTQTSIFFAPSPGRNLIPLRAEILANEEICRRGQIEIHVPGIDGGLLLTFCEENKYRHRRGGWNIVAFRDAKAFFPNGDKNAPKNGTRDPHNAIGVSSNIRDAIELANVLLAASTAQ